MSPRTCKYHGDAAPSAGYYRCTCEMRPRPTSCRQDPNEEHPGCFVPLPVEAPVPTSRPVTFAAVLAHHRKKASDNRADQAWHAEAVECLVALVNHFDRCDAECECCDMADCYLREARKAVEGEG